MLDHPSKSSAMKLLASSFLPRTAVIALVVVGLTSCHLSSLTIWSPAPAPPTAVFEVERVRDVAYYDGPDADGFRHRLDLYLPKGKKDYPVVVLVHGGAWIMSDKRHFGLVSSVGEFLASQGIGAVLPNYRLSPAVKHPEHIKDVARAVAWTKAHIAERGGCADQMFLAGHSAGGHLVSLLATDDSYLKAVGVPPTDIKGVISVSGIYRIPPGSLGITLNGDTSTAFRLDELRPLRGEGGWFTSMLSGKSNIPLNVNLYGPAFGDDPQIRKKASPIEHVHLGLPPFLLVSAEKDLPTLPGMAEEFHKALLSFGCEAQYLQVEKRNHNSVMYSAIDSEDFVARAMLEFIRRYSGRR